MNKRKIIEIYHIEDEEGESIEVEKIEDTEVANILIDYLQNTFEPIVNIFENVDLEVTKDE